MMKMRNIYQSKKGVASLYAVIFATILFGVITLSFVRIILSESRQSGDDELSQSAYDSAMAGIEDAKRAVNAYYACLNGGKDQAFCDANYNPFDATCEDFAKTSSRLKTVLGYQNAEGEIKLQETSATYDRGDETTTDQAYTCITMTDQVEDYRSTLSNDTRVRVVPIGIESSQLSRIKNIEFKWFSENNSTQLERLYSNKVFMKSSETSNVPVISLTLLYTGATFSVNDFNNSTATNYDTMVLLPSDSGEATNSIGWSAIQNAGNSDTRNDPFLIKCQKGEFACNVSLDVAGNLPSGGNALLIVSMPYGETITDFAVALYDSAGNVIDFEGAQISVDSTGRANQLYRRVETRLDPVDSYFPYPQFAAELDGEGGSELMKNFWITYNCWTEKGVCENNGSL